MRPALWFSVRAGTQTWGELRGECRIAQCSAGRVELNGGDGAWAGPWSVRLPAADLNSVISVGCCAEYTLAGGCAEPSGLYGGVSGGTQLKLQAYVASGYSTGGLVLTSDGVVRTNASGLRR